METYQSISKLDLLEEHPNFIIGDPEKLVHMDWSTEYKENHGKGPSNDTKKNPRISQSKCFRQDRIHSAGRGEGSD
jgi:hypothetical protein